MEIPFAIAAKTCACKENNRRKVTYTFLDAYHSLCVDKKEILMAQLEACGNLLKHSDDKIDTKAIETEVAELKMTLDLMA